jgi:hypothetical protein
MLANRLGYQLGIATCLEGLAEATQRAADSPAGLARAARLLGTADVLCQAMGAPATC